MSYVQYLDTKYMENNFFKSQREKHPRLLPALISNKGYTKQCA